MNTMPKPIHVRIDDALRAEFEQAMELTGMGETQLVKACIKAFVEHVRTHGEITLPLALVSKTELEGKILPSARSTRPAPSAVSYASAASRAESVSLNEDPALLAPLKKKAK